jgi:predicted DNA helicase
LAEQDVKVLRIGNPARINQDLISYSLDYQLQDEADYQQAQKAWETIDELKEQQKQFVAATGQSRRGLRDKQIRDLAAEGKTSRGIPPGKIQSMARWLNLQEQISEQAEEALELEAQATRKLLDDTTVVCATNATAGASVLEDYKFDRVVIDEATQSIEPATLIPMIKGSRFIMAGDHQQLPPTVLNRDAQESLQITLFERLRAQYPSEMNRMLTVQYRMHESIMAFPNQAFYDAQLKAHPSVARHSLANYELNNRDSGLPSWVANAIKPEPVSLFLDTQDTAKEEQAPRSHSYRNPTEASVLYQLGEALINAGLAPHELGIISPYQEQVRLLKDLFGHPGNPEIKTVDGFQGREKTVILLSFVRSNETGQLGFLTDYRRLNVALTRARRKLIMLGNANMLSQNKVYSKLLEQVETREIPVEQEAR